MKTCPKCGYQTDNDNAKYCYRCGGNMPEIETTDESDSKLVEGKYRIWVDGKQEPRIVESNETIDITSKADTNCFENVVKSFTINELKNGRIIQGVFLDDVNERVMVNTNFWAKPKEKTIKLKVSPDNYQDFLKKNLGVISVQGPEGEINVDKELEFVLRGEDILWWINNSIKVSVFPNSEIEQDGSAECDQTNYIVRIKVKKIISTI